MDIVTQHYGGESTAFVCQCAVKQGTEMDVPCQSATGTREQQVLYTSRAVTHGKTVVFPNASVIPIDGDGLVCRRSDGRLECTNDTDSEGKILYVSETGRPQWVPRTPPQYPVPVANGGTGNAQFASGPSNWLVVQPGGTSIATANPPTAIAIAASSCTGNDPNASISVTAGSAAETPGFVQAPVLTNYVAAATSPCASQTLAQLIGDRDVRRGTVVLVCTCTGKQLTLTWTTPVVSIPPADAFGPSFLVSGTFNLDPILGPEAYVLSKQTLSGNTLQLAAVFVDDEETLTFFTPQRGFAPISCHGVFLENVSSTQWNWKIQTTYLVGEDPSTAAQLLLIDYAAKLQFFVYLLQP